MKWICVFLGFVFFILVFLKRSQAAQNVSIQSGKVAIQGGYVAIGSTQAISIVSGGGVNTAGQCIGILCGVTHAN